jgi:archaellin
MLTLSKRKRAFVGIGTLIIFIAAILTAAIAAGVIIRTSGVLQERSYAVAGQARKRLVTGLEVTEVYGNSNVSVPDIPQLEINIRLRPGASEVNLRQMGMTVTTETFARAATLQHSSANRYNESLLDVTLTNDSWYSLTADLDNDGVTDYVKILARSGNDYLLFNVSSEDILANVSLGVDLANAGTTPVKISLDEAKINANDNIYGYVTINGNATENNNLTISSSVSGNKFFFTQFPAQDLCNFETVIPERFFCYNTKLGDSDPILEPGEAYVLYYKFRNEYALAEDEEVQISFVPKDGAITYLYAKIPAVVRKTKVLIWPS